MRNKVIAQWHEEMVLQVADILGAALVQAMARAERAYGDLPDSRQERLNLYYDGSKAVVLLGVLKDAGALVGLDFPGITIVRQGSRISAEQVTEPLEKMSLQQIMEQNT